MSNQLLSDEIVTNIGDILINTNRPLKERFRALFTLRNIGGLNSIKEISKCFQDSSALLKHECAYVLGQMQDENAVNILIKVLDDDSQETIVRHEAGEALGAIGINDTISSALKKHLDSPIKDISETCYLAVRKINWLKENNNKDTLSDDNPYRSVDPAPPSTEKDNKVLERILLNENDDLFERYRALFKLRNIGTQEAIAIISKGLFIGSSLFRHEIAYVLGQLQNPLSIPSLKSSLGDLNESGMVRHESAEALGSIGMDECNDFLKQFLTDKSRLVRESCDVALDMCDYESKKEFQYANSLISLTS